MRSKRFKEDEERGFYHEQVSPNKNSFSFKGDQSGSGCNPGQQGSFRRQQKPSEMPLFDKNKIFELVDDKRFGETPRDKRKKFKKSRTQIETSGIVDDEYKVYREKIREQKDVRVKENNLVEF